MFTFWRPIEKERLDVLCGDFTGRSLSGLVRDELQVVLPDHAALVGCASGDRRLAPLGSIIVINRHEPCSWQPYDGSAWSARMFVIGNDLVPPGAWFPQPVIRDDDLRWQLSAVFDELCKPIRSTACEETLGRALRALTNRHSGPAPTAEACATIAVNAARRLRAYLSEHATDRVTLDGMARVAGLSKYHLIRAFQREYGLSPRAYQMRLRLARAMTLAGTGMALSRVTHDAGFADQSHLTRRFRDYLGMTPRQYARQISAPRSAAAEAPHLTQPRHAFGA